MNRPKGRNAADTRGGGGSKAGEGACFRPATAGEPTCDGACLFGDPGLRDVDDVHDDAALEHLGQAGLDGEGRLPVVALAVPIRVLVRRHHAVHDGGSQRFRGEIVVRIGVWVCRARRLKT